MIVRGTSIVDVGGIAGCGKACEEKGGEELKHDLATTRVSLNSLSP